MVEWDRGQITYRLLMNRVKTREKIATWPKVRFCHENEGAPDVLQQFRDFFFSGRARNLTTHRGLKQAEPRSTPRLPPEKRWFG